MRSPTTKRPKRRRKTTKRKRIGKLPREVPPELPEDTPSIMNPIAPLLETLTQAQSSEEPPTFEWFIEPLLPDLIEASAIAQVQRIKHDGNVRILLSAPSARRNNSSNAGFTGTTNHPNVATTVKSYVGTAGCLSKPYARYRQEATFSTFGLCLLIALLLLPDLFRRAPFVPRC